VEGGEGGGSSSLASAPSPTSGPLSSSIISSAGLSLTAVSSLCISISCMGSCETDKALDTDDNGRRKTGDAAAEVVRDIVVWTSSPCCCDSNVLGSTGVASGDAVDVTGVLGVGNGIVAGVASCVNAAGVIGVIGVAVPVKGVV